MQSSSEKFICLEYSDLDIIFPQKDAYTAVFCDDSNFHIDENGSKKFFFDKKLIPYINADDCTIYFNQNSSSKSLSNSESRIKTCIVIHNKNLFENEKFYGLVTTSDCKVRELNFSSFSVFSDFYCSFLKKNGLIACRFDSKKSSKIGYLVDIEKVLQKVVKGRAK